MKVIYNDPDGRKGTYHPKLGYLISGKPFELADDAAKIYIRSGLLKKFVSVTRAKPAPIRRADTVKKEGRDGHTDNRP